MTIGGDKSPTRVSFIQDRFSYFLFSKFGFFGYLLFFGLLPNVLKIMVSMFENSFFSIPIAKDLGLGETPCLTDTFHWLMILILFLGGFFSFKFFTNISSTFVELWENKIISLETTLESYNDFLKKYEKKANGGFVYVIGLIFIFLNILNFQIFAINPQEEMMIIQKVLWINPIYFPFTNIINSIIVYINIFMIGVIIWKIYVVVSMMRDFSNNKNIKLATQFNPYKKTSLQPLGELSLKLSQTLLYFILVPIVFYIQAVYLEPNLFQMWFNFCIESIIFYVVISTFLFLYPLLSAHDFLKKEKSNLIKNINKKLDSLYTNIFLTDLGETKNYDVLDNYVNMRELYSDAQKISTWPFDTEILFKFMGAITLPILLVIFEVVITLIIK